MLSLVAVAADDDYYSPTKATANAAAAAAAVTQLNFSFVLSAEAAFRASFGWNISFFLSFFLWCLPKQWLRVERETRNKRAKARKKEIRRPKTMMASFAIRARALRELLTRSVHS